MKTITTAKEMIAFSDSRGAAGERVGFVPTMGALHAGHLSLVETARSMNDLVVVSVFVNPTQFNDPKDLEKYPRTLDSDTELLEKSGVDVLFYPSVEEIYPDKTEVVYELDGLDQTMEGPNRPGHFNGVVQVVTRLFDIVKPNSAFFGEKDFQQLSIIRHMAAKLGYSIEIIGCPTMREQSGLAMSSRNMRLSESGHEVAAHISRSLKEIANRISGGERPSDVLTTVLNNLSKEEEIDVEYLALADPITLQPATNNSASIRACIAAYVEGVRLIDNMQVK